MLELSLHQCLSGCWSGGHDRGQTGLPAGGRERSAEGRDGEGTVQSDKGGGQEAGGPRGQVRDHYKAIRPFYRVFRDRIS